MNRSGLPIIASTLALLGLSLSAWAIPCAAQPSAPAPPTPSAPASDAKTSGAQRAVRSVCRVEVSVGGRPVGHGSGFVVQGVDGRRLIVTNHHVVEGADAAMLKFSDAEVILPLDLLASDRHADLAVLRVRQAGMIDDRTPLVVREDAAVGEELFAIGFPVDLGITMTRGIVSGIRKHEEVKDPLPSSAKIDPQWIQTDCTINRGNSGGPMVDAEGRVLAVSTWKLIRSSSGSEVSNTNFGASGATLSAFLKGAGDTPIAFPRAVREANSSTVVPAPSPLVPPAPRGKAIRLEEALSALNSFDRMARCSTCNGSGTTTKLVETGRRGDGVISQPIHERQSVECSTCNGGGFRSGVTFNRAVKRFADAAASLDRTSEGVERYDRRISKLFNDFARDNSRGAARALGDFAGHETPAVGDGIAGAGNSTARVGLEIPNADAVLLVALPNQRVAVVRSFALRETAGNGPLFFVGAYGGRTALDDGTELIFIDRAYVVRGKN